MSNIESGPEWTEIADLFAQLTEVETEARRLRLEQIRASNPRLASEVASLLKSHDCADDFFEEQVPRLFASLVADPELQPGERVLHFEIGKVLGEGASAKVYMARDLELQRDVALKVTSNRSREASSLAQFRVDGIVQVYSEHMLDHSGKKLRLICLQLVPGPTLADLIAKIRACTASGARDLIQYLDACALGEVPFEPAALKWREQLQTRSLREGIALTGIRLAEILDQVHSQNGLHLDIKPANILMDPYGRLFLSDFNISTVTDRAGERAHNSLGGTPRYMAPEQARLFEEGVDPSEVALDARVDVYSLGVVLKELLEAGRCEDEQLIDVLNGATSPDQSSRTATAGQLAADLTGWLRRHMAENEMPPIPTRLHWIRSCPLAAVILATLLSQLIASAINISYNQLQIVGALTVRQNSVFMNAVAVYNLIAYPFLAFMAYYSLSGLTRQPLQVTRARRAALRIPIVMSFVISLGWLPGAWIFPRVIDFFAGPLSPEIYLQFEVSIWLGWLISWTTSITFSLYILARVIYPAYWSGHSDQAARELRFCQGLNRALALVAALFPMSGALLMLWISAFDEQSLKMFLLVTIGFGLVNLLIVQRVTQRTDQIFAIFKKI